MNSRLVVQSIRTIQRHILKFQPFLTSFSIFQAFNDLFWAKWPKNWKALEMNFEDVETLQGIIISPTEHVLKSWEGYGKKWMHFVYKLDHPLRSIMVLDENSSVTKAFHFFKLIWTQTFCAFNMHYSKPHPKISTLSNFICYLSCIQWFVLSSMALKLESTWNELWRCWNLAWYHHFAHIACAKKLRVLRQKLDALRVQTGPYPSKYEGFRRKVICCKGISFF